LTIATESGDDVLMLQHRCLGDRPLQPRRRKYLSITIFLHWNVSDRELPNHHWIVGLILPSFSLAFHVWVISANPVVYSSGLNCSKKILMDKLDKFLEN
jgi:hypothetical protein